MLTMAKSIAGGLTNPAPAFTASLLNIASYAQVGAPTFQPGFVPMLAEIALRPTEVGDAPIELAAAAVTMVIVKRAGSTDDSAINVYSPTSSSTALEIPSNFFGDDEREVDVHTTIYGSAPNLPLVEADTDDVVADSEAVAIQVYLSETQSPYDVAALQEINPFKVSISHGTPTDGTTSAGQRYDKTAKAWTSEGCEMDFASSTQSTAVFTCKKGSVFRVVEKPIKESLTIMDASAVEGDDLVFVVQISQPMSYALVVPYRVSSGTAISGLDFTVSGSVLQINAGETKTSFVVKTRSDGEAEGHSETLTATLVVDYDVLKSTATGTIYERPTPAPTTSPSPAPTKAPTFSPTKVWCCFFKRVGERCVAFLMVRVVLRFECYFP